MEERRKLNVQIYEEAGEWFVNSRAGDLDEAARHAFDDWLRKSPEHVGAYLEIATIWDEALSLDPTGKFDPATLIAQATLNHENVVELTQVGGVEAAKRDVAAPTASAAPAEPAIQPEVRHRATPAVLGRRRISAMAASLVAVVAVALTYLEIHQAPTYAAATGEQRSVTLADGSTVELDSRSKIIVRYSKAERRVQLLQGQALFHVAKNAGRPFIVKAGDTLVRAVGTEFDVYRKRAGTVVTVVEGRVAVLAGHAAALDDRGLGAGGSGAPPQPNLAFQTVPPGQVGNIMLAAGEQLTVTSKLIRMSEHPNIANATAWTHHRLVFESASLADVVYEFNRYNHRQLIVAGPQLNSFHISGVFSSTDPTSLIRFLRARPELRLVETGTKIRIEQKTP